MKWTILANINFYSIGEVAEKTFHINKVSSTLDCVR